MNPSLSSDGRRLAVVIVDKNKGGDDIWIMDVAGNSPSHFTFAPGEEEFPTWSPDDKYIAFSMNGDIYRRVSNGKGEDELVFASDYNKWVSDWTMDGKYIVFTESTGTGMDISYVPASGERRSISYLKTRANEANGQVSPDGKWMVYESDETGKMEIYVRPFPDAQGGKWQISSNGGTDPRWRRDGRELFYFGSDDKLMAVTFKADTSGFAVLKTTALFPTRKTAAATNYSVSPDGQRFLIDSLAENTSSSDITVVANWHRLLEQHSPAK